MVLRFSPTLAAVSLIAFAASACGGSSKPRTAQPRPISEVGECVAIESGGQLSAQPDLRRADRDLNRDGRAEIVVSDRKLCRGKNCQWNLFAWDGSCNRFVGTIAGASIETGDIGDSGFPELRSWWQLAGGERALLHVYQFGGRGYQLIETLLCRQTGGDGIQCALEESL